MSVDLEMEDRDRERRRFKEMEGGEEIEKCITERGQSSWCVFQ